MFCIVRNPFDRLVSEFRYAQHKYYRSRKCSVDGLNSYVARHISMNEDNKLKDFGQNCHLLSQTAYIHSSKGGTAGSLGCTTILRYENLNNDFLNLTKWSGMKLGSLDGLRYNQKSNQTNCNVTDKDLSSDSLARIASAYAKDFHVLGYPVKLGR